MGAVNDIFPTDYVSNNVGDTVATLYMHDSESKGVYTNGKQILNERAKVKFEGAFLGATNKKYNPRYADSRVGQTIKFKVKTRAKT